MTSTRKISSS